MPSTPALCTINSRKHSVRCSLTTNSSLSMSLKDGAKWLCSASSRASLWLQLRSSARSPTASSLADLLASSVVRLTDVLVSLSVLTASGFPSSFFPPLPSLATKKVDRSRVSTKASSWFGFWCSPFRSQSSFWWSYLWSAWSRVSPCSAEEPNEHSTDNFNLPPIFAN